jgi:spore maturation protein SpmB
MKKFKANMKLIFAAIGLFVIIMDTGSAIQGAREGIDICIRTLIPTLLPFFVISGYFCSALSGKSLPILSPILKFCGIPKGIDALLIVGLLGGYPVGAQTITDTFSKGLIEKEQARRLLGFCNNAGPAFVFGVAGSVFNDVRIPWCLFSILILSSLLTGYMLPNKCGEDQITVYHHEQDFVETFEKSLKAIAKVCGWVIIFRVLYKIIERWALWLLPVSAQILISGILEISNGCCALTDVSTTGLRFILCAFILSFGGLCVYLQTKSVTGSLGTGYYFPGKIIQSMISVILAILLQRLLFEPYNRVPLSTAIAPIFFLVIYIFVIKNNQKKISVAFLEKKIYNVENEL